MEEVKLKKSNLDFTLLLLEEMSSSGQLAEMQKWSDGRQG